MSDGDRGDAQELGPFVRWLRARPARVWEAWTDASKLARWFGPVGFTVTEAVMDARVGGAWRVVIAGDDGVPYPIGGQVLAVDPGERLVLAFSTEGYPEEFYDAYRAAGGVSRPLVGTMTVTLTELDGGTRLSVLHEFDLVADARANRRLGTDGLTQMTSRLELLALMLEPDPRALFLSRSIRAPRERVWAAFTDPRALDAWWGPDGFTTTTESFSLEVGGAWRFTFQHAVHGVFPNRIRWTAITPPERLDWLHDGGEGTDAFTTIVWFEVEGDGTRVHLIQLHSSAEARARVEAFGAVELGQQTLGKLAAYCVERHR